MNRIRIIAALSLMFLVLSLSSELFAQNRIQIENVDVSDVEIDLQQTPELTYSGPKLKKTPRNREWVEVDVEFEVEGKSENKYVDELLFKYYVVLDDKKKTMLVTDVTHVNIPLDEKIYSSVYISPATLEKLLAKKNFSKNDVRGFAVEVIHRGKAVGGEASKKTSRWWESREQTRGLLLPKSRTPFAPLWWDRYAEEKPQD